MKAIALKPGLYTIFYEFMKQIAESYGYNLIVHGSMNRDLDLIAIPWNDHCCFTKEQMMIKEFQKYLTGKEIIQNNGNIPYTTLPGNRHSYVIDLNRGDRSGEWVRFEDREYYLDISVVQTVLQTNPEYTTGMVNLTQQLVEKDKEIEILKVKVQKWNDLGQMIAKCYNSYDESGNEIPAKIQDASLLDIGEMAAIAFGYL